MDVWGLGSRSLPRSLWQLLVRPGRFISDYINGKWQASFPPVKMLVIVALALYFLGRLIYPEFWNDLFDEGTESTATGAVDYTDVVITWIVSHPEWSFLALFSILIIPTWFVFRYAPHNTRHTLPQGFFIQVFLTIQFYLWLFVFSAVFMLFGLGTDLATTVAFTIILPMMVFIDYKLVFGYRFWGTLWRVIAVILLAFIKVFALVIISALYERLLLSRGDSSILVILLLFLWLMAFVVLFLLVIDMINRKRWRTAGWLQTLKYPLIMLGVVLALTVLNELVKPGTLSKFVNLFFF